MGKKYDFYGVSKIQIGDPGDGVMGGTLVDFTDIAENTVAVNITKQEIEKMFTETDRNTPYRSFTGGEGSYNAVFGLLGVTLEQLVDFLGGTHTAAGVGVDEKWVAPTTTPEIYKSIAIWTRETASGQNMVFFFPYAKLTAGTEGNLTFNNVANLAVEIEANLPVSAAGVEGDPFYIVLEGSAT